jgi:hypothetical protein
MAERSYRVAILPAGFQDMHAAADHTAIINPMACHAYRSEEAV